MKRNSSLELSLDAAVNVARGTSVLIDDETELRGENDGQGFDLALRQLIPMLGIPFL